MNLRSTYFMDVSSETVSLATRPEGSERGDEMEWESWGKDTLNCAICLIGILRSKDFWWPVEWSTNSSCSTKFVIYVQARWGYGAEHSLDMVDVNVLRPFSNHDLCIFALKLAFIASSRSRFWFLRINSHDSQQAVLQRWPVRDQRNSANGSTFGTHICQGFSQSGTSIK